MQLHTISPSNKPDIVRLYKEAFPRSERKPFSLMERRERFGHMEILSIEEEVFLGLAITVLHEDLVLLDYFAISSGARGQGAGGRALSLLKKRYAGRRLFLEIEFPEESASNYADRLRRREFYRRHDITPVGLDIEDMGVHMEVLSYGCPVSFAEFTTLLEKGLGKAMFRMVRPVLLSQTGE